MRQHLKWWAATAALLMAASPGMAIQRDNPFSDVPKSHWAYSAVKDAVESGIIQGYDGKFLGNKSLTRYQMAKIVQNLMRRMSGKKVGDFVGGGSVTEQDLRNLEALTIEFADELALLNVKVSTLEDNVAGLKHDVEALKGSVPGAKTHKPEKRAGISGLVSVRGVMTDNNGGNTGFVNASSSAAAAGLLGALANAGGSLALPSLTRYQGSVVTPPAGTAATAPAAGVYKSQSYFTVPQFSLAFDREIDEGLRMHAQVDLDADTSQTADAVGTAAPSPAAFVFANGLPGAGGMAKINEAWLESEDLGIGWGAKLGAFALPFSDEHNGRYRTLDWTITPSAQTWRYESYRPVGLELITNDSLFSWNLRLGLFSGLDNQNGALFFNEYRIAGAPFNGPLTDAPMGLGLSGALGAPDEAVGLGYFARIGDHPNEGGFGWDINYMANGDMKPTAGAGVQATDQEFAFVSGTLDYYWDWFAIVAQYYSGVSKNGVAASAFGRGLFATAADTKSTSAYILANYRWNPDNNFSLRYETAEDETAAIARFTVNTMTFCWNRIVSDHSLLQVEYVSPEAKLTSLVAGSTGTVGKDRSDRMLQANYKLVF